MSRHSVGTDHADGAWAAHLKPVEGELEWFVQPRHGRVAMLGKRVFATIRREKANCWMTCIPGFSWAATDGARRFGVKNSVVRAFATPAEAQRAVVLAYQIRNLGGA